MAFQIDRFLFFENPAQRFKLCLLWIYKLNLVLLSQSLKNDFSLYEWTSLGWIILFKHFFNIKNDKWWKVMKSDEKWFFYFWIPYSFGCQKKRNVNDFFGNKKYALKHFLMINIKVFGNNCFDSKNHEANSQNHKNIYIYIRIIKIFWKYMILFF